MTDGEAYRKLGMIAQRWRDLAERRRAHFTDLYESGRWKKYYGDDRLLLRMQEVVASADGWAVIASSFAPPAPALAEAAQTSELPENPENPSHRAAA
jgi:uncharacterized repeat protein (TIGR03809 family)